MLQDLYDDGFVFVGVLWVFLFREEMGLMGLGFDIVCLGFSYYDFGVYLSFLVLVCISILLSMFINLHGIGLRRLC